MPDDWGLRNTADRMGWEYDQSPVWAAIGRAWEPPR